VHLYHDQQTARPALYRGHIRPDEAHLPTSRGHRRRIHKTLQSEQARAVRIIWHDGTGDHPEEAAQALAPAMEAQPDRGEQPAMARSGRGFGI